ncbi:eEF1A lysine and N-terminal methyltransferase isoform X1 [Protobothrops mucrosquamatus]|uniref:eEF1A lysine and N-terminal methyltransferase isoform X1 n=1 Tax=Protobothrops mucrosquamatus TaxID=103944 RepID=UPI000775B877|nr:eEF1A lysine and N-terminal methyltransferase isoform X1 [Protobothrops mucrosquamatus]
MEELRLLPRHARDFASSEYWDRFFRKRGERAFEWYGEWSGGLGSTLGRYLRLRDSILVVGCGNSELSEQLYDEGYHNIISVDINEQVVKQMQERSTQLRPKMTYMVMDVLQMDFPDEHFQVVFDKGTLDTLLTDGEETSLKRAERMFAEIGRVLQFGGRYLCVSLAQAHVLKAAVEYFSQEGWMVRVHQVPGQKTDTSEQEFALPVFVYVMTKIRPVPGSVLCILEVCTETQEKPVRFKNSEHLIDAVKERQHYSLLRNQLNKNSSVGTISLDLCSKDTGQTRYTLHVVHSPKVKVLRDKQFAIFIIPQGRETEWLFGTEEGQKQLAVSAGFWRLVTVALHRNQHYDNMGAIQAELSEKVMELAPPGLPPQQQVPFLSVDGDIGIRTIQHCDTSPFSGEYVIEDVKGDGACYFRRLIFLSNRNVVQSEARLSSRVSHKGNKQKQKKKDHFKPHAEAACVAIDKSYLCCAHHRAMVAGLCLLENPENLPTPSSYDVIMFDVDSKDSTLGISCPPPAFVDKIFLQKVKTLLKTEGIFILNLVCRDILLRGSVLAAIKETFPVLYTQKIEGEVNEIIFCQQQDKVKLSPRDFQEKAQILEKALQQPGQEWDSTYVLADMLETIRLV